jgi:hypothetical protein
MLGLALLGVHPLWPRQTLTVQEAALTGNDAAIARLFMRGAHPNRLGPIPGDTRMLTPLEAAIGSREPRTLRTVLKYGATVEGDAGRVAVCVAHARAPHLLPILVEHGAPAIDPGLCPDLPR